MAGEDQRTAPVTRYRVALAVGLAGLLIACAWYLIRPDTVGLRRAGGGWLELTGPPLPAPAAFLGVFLVFGTVPAALSRTILGKSPGALGLGPGDWKATVLLCALGLPLAAASAYVASTSLELQQVYPLGGMLAANLPAFTVHAATYLLYYLGFEYLFRGFLLLGLEDELGALNANVLQSVLATAFHLGKPPLEMLAVLPASLLFGWLTLRTRALWCALVLHWTVGVALDALLVFR
ncbi:hypothetical protein HRbin33_01964 [bacterium HR33]|nr:hypothetical protein HRbin33_01964 [bacterium HR33]